MGAAAGVAVGAIGGAVIANALGMLSLTSFISTPPSRSFVQIL
jgi:hypothetical protein